MKFYFLLFLFLITYIAPAREVDKVRSGDTIESIAKRNISRVWNKYSGDLNDYALDLKKWNPQVEDWSHLKENQYIYVDYPYYHFISQATWATPLGVDEGPDEFKQRASGYLFYASSSGQYTELTPDGDQVTSGQNFPVTLGGGFSIADREKKRFMLMSAYWAQPTNGSVSNADGTTQFAIPGEQGANWYYQRYFKDFTFGIYGGYDYEKLNTFNTSEIILGEPIRNVSNQIHYGTLGAQKVFTLFGLNMNFKASYSQVFSSQSDFEKAFTGSKYILYLTYKPQGRLTFSVFYKHHALNGVTNLNIDRVGFSIGVLVF